MKFAWLVYVHHSRTAYQISSHGSADAGDGGDDDNMVALAFEVVVVEVNSIMRNEARDLGLISSSIPPPIIARISRTAPGSCCSESKLSIAKVLVVLSFQTLIG
ncbi:hypothetical protein J5N97_015758 [Dioscorea zingiberensis]|uniref:Uncharacterized protein n=1 Tax=Dioscorea zingiberensis TaxID=325984 RepID=A0A9D5CJQ6_9LILI|nr:hypothetical protein J5N97_015758 [Dioscorea zingiberensis]